jgi:hypothetical protein
LFRKEKRMETNLLKVISSILSTDESRAILALNGIDVDSMIVPIGKVNWGPSFRSTEEMFFALDLNGRHPSLVLYEGNDSSGGTLELNEIYIERAE